MSQTNVIVVTGATGNAGGAVLRAVLGAGMAARAVVRQADAQLPAGAERVVGDLNDPESLAASLNGATGLFLLSGYDGIERLLALAREAGVQRVVLLSSSAAPGGDLSNAVARYHILSEQAVRESRLEWTFLQPNAFMSNTYRWNPQLAAGDVIRLPFAQVPAAMIDPDDLGAVAAAAFAGAAHRGHAYRLSGPESLLPAEQVATVARVLGRDLRFEALTDAQARAEMEQTMPPEYVDAFLRFYVDGDVDESQVLPTAAEILGRPLGTFEQWVRARADTFPCAA